MKRVCVGTLLVGGLLSYVMFDSGATNSFITPECAAGGNIRGDPDGCFGVVRVAGGALLAVQGRASGVDVQIAVESMPPDLYISPVELYDVILGMDWLDQHKVHLDCHRGRV